MQIYLMGQGANLSVERSVDYDKVHVMCREETPICRHLSDDNNTLQHELSFVCIDISLYSLQ